jgi:hypothetical protein
MLLLYFGRVCRDQSGAVVGIMPFVEPNFVLVIVAFHTPGFDKTIVFVLWRGLGC